MVPSISSLLIKPDLKSCLACASVDMNRNVSMLRYISDKKEEGESVVIMEVDGVVISFSENPRDAVAGATIGSATSYVYMGQPFITSKTTRCLLFVVGAAVVVVVVVVVAVV